MFPIRARSGHFPHSPCIFLVSVRLTNLVDPRSYEPWPLLRPPARQNVPYSGAACGLWVLDHDLCASLGTVRRWSLAPSRAVVREEWGISFTHAPTADNGEAPATTGQTTKATTFAVRRLLLLLLLLLLSTAPARKSSREASFVVDASTYRDPSRAGSILASSSSSSRSCIDIVNDATATAERV